MSKRTGEYIAVIEGGGSTCRGVLYDPHHNQPVSSLVLDNHPCNIYREPERTLASILKMTEILGAEATPLVLCLPGISHHENVTRLKEQLKTHSFETVHIASDAIAGLLGAYETLEDGQGVLIGGTGTIALGYAGGQLWRAGTPETEKACGSWIAREAHRRAATDPDLKRIFSSHTHMETAPDYIISQLTPDIFAAAEAGNATSQSILQEAADSAADHMNRLRDFGITRYALCGPVAVRLKPLISSPTLVAQGNGMDGAVKLALSLHKDPQNLADMTYIRRIEDEPPAKKAAIQ